jgi:FAD dependent monooxygenase
MAPSKPFTAIIIGGSVAGLTLAHTFARANINYVLLEARNSLAPQLGAGIVIMPNGCRVLDQMGLLETMKEFMTPMALYYRRKRNGEEMGVADWPLRVSKRFVIFSDLTLFLGLWERW